MLSCKEISSILASDALEGSPWHRRMSVRFHLMMCRHCRRYKEQLVKIGEAARSLWDSWRPDSATVDRIEGAAISRAEELRK
jgi:hypothetical protein